MPDSTITDLLRDCDQKSPYGLACLQLSAEGAEILVISDLHLGPGQSNGCYTATENFFADASFQRFLRHKAACLGDRRAILVINGDMVDFLRTTGYPEQPGEFEAWRQLLADIGISKTIEQLRGSISGKERKFGLQTDNYKSVWKLDQIIRGHSLFFSSLAEWMASGHQLIVVKGNHDLEWYWPEVRNFLRLALSRQICEAKAKSGHSTVEDALTRCVAPNLIFVDDTLVIDKVLYIEHGHRYDKFAWVVGGPLLPGGTELNLPFGSFFNRYVLNRVELAFPYADNVRPANNLLPLLIRERFFVAMKLFFYQIPLALRTIPKGYYRYIFGRVAVLGLSIFTPLVVGLAIVLSAYPQFQGTIIRWFRVLSPGGSGLTGGFLSLVLSYFLGRIVAYFQLTEPSSLTSDAQSIFARNPQYRFITMGHTHDPDQFGGEKGYYLNTGTWIPIVEVDTAQVREDKTYTFLELRRNAHGDLEPQWLQRWDDEAGRSEDLLIRQSK